ncbi:FtsX-like permease family protein [Phocaeicola dorei]|uniref:ABC transporter permease n=1 Tax=Phocaeicola dorei TaxID=357276 RepID=UPI00147930CB|nr:ABC transporter permease [Phocaeicola dorei]QJR55236.1 FtsX-like permease family protein [Phocaeicola dorei]QJR59963.1 FtsX-like permease family protein [Phocaeicola dorei]
MIKHCLKIAIRNLVKYKVQSAVSILGLAVGFVCFSLSLYWIHYEMTYDHFRQDADRIYMVRTNDEYTEGKISTRVPYSLAAYLAQHFPDIAVAAPFHLISERISVNDKYQDAVFSSADSAWMNLMDIRIIKGNRNFMLPKDNAEIAITEEAAKKWFRTEDPIGKEVKMLRRTKKICAIVQAENRHTNFPFDFIGNPELGKTWWYITWSILIKVKPDTDIEELESKINANLPAELKQVTLTRKTGIERIILTPLSKLHYAKDFRDDKEAGITFQYIIYFSIAGILIITCALINYLTLFINRMRVRQREMALRMIHGANIRSLVSLLTVEFLLLLACAVTTGFLLIEICFPSFIELTGIDTAKSSLYGEAFLFIGLISLIILTAIIGLLYILYHRSLHLSLRYNTGRSTGTQLRRGSIVLQLFVCLSFIGCTVLINQQLDYLRHRDLGLKIKNRGSFSVMGDMDYTPLIRKIKELPMITEVMQPDYYPIVSQLTAIGQFDNWEGLDIPIDTPVPVKLFLGKEDFFRFYDITLLAGEWLDDLSTYEDIIINESLARRMGWSPQEAIGKHIIQSYITYIIVGVVKDCHYGAPTLPIPHTGFLVGEQMGLMQRSAGILFKYKEGTWNECRKALEHLYQTECSPENILRLNSEEEVYNNYLRSEEMLTRLLSFASLVCILTAMFGIYSLVTLTCEQRRKEIAIRKVNGATVWSILYLFFREYLIMLCIAALFAFPITYVIIKQWILNYVRQVSISPLPFILILIGLALTVIAGISWRVWKAANENPAEVIKNE